MRAGGRAIKYAAILVAVYLLFTVTPLADYYSAPLYVTSNPQKSDVIVLLSSGQIDGDWLTPDAAQRLLGAPRVPLAAMLDWQADWIARGLPGLGKPTHFETRDGKY